MQTRCGPLRMRGYIEARPHLIITLYKYPNIGAALSSRHTSRGGYYLVNGGRGWSRVPAERGDG